MKISDLQIGDSFEKEYLDGNGNVKTKTVEVTEKYTDEKDRIHVITQPV